MIAFILAHSAALSSLALILVNEFMANNPKVQANSIGQLIVNAAKAWLSPRATKAVQ